MMKEMMKDLWPLIVFVLFVSGGGCSLAGTWWQKNKNRKNTDEYQNRNSKTSGEGQR